MKMITLAYCWLKREPQDQYFAEVNHFSRLFARFSAVWQSSSGWLTSLPTPEPVSSGPGIEGQDKQGDEKETDID
jgi:hypothetical protein